MLKKILIMGIFTSCVLSSAVAEDVDKVKESMLAAEAAAKESKYEVMLESYQNALKLASEKDKFKTQLKIADNIEKINLLKMKVEAVMAYENAVKLASNTDEKVSALIKLGKTRYAAGYPDDATALKTFQDILEMPDSGPKHKADTYMAIADICPDLGSFEKACRQAAAVPGITPEQKADAYGKLINKHRGSYGTSDFAAAAKILTEVIALEDIPVKQRISFSFQLGGVQQDLHRFEDARQSIKRIMEIPNVSNNDIAAAWMGIAGIYLADVKYMEDPSAKQYNEAVKCYLEILKLEKIDYNGAWVGLAKAYFALNDYENAMKYVKQVTDNPKADGNSLCQMLCIAGDISTVQENLQAAFESYEKGSQAKGIGNDQKIIALDKLITISFTLKNYGAAMKYLEELKKTPGRYAKRNKIDLCLETTRKFQTQENTK